MCVDVHACALTGPDLFKYTQQASVMVGMWDDLIVSLLDQAMRLVGDLWPRTAMIHTD